MKPTHKCDSARMALLYIRQQFICTTFKFDAYDLLRIQAAILVVLLHVSAIGWNMISPRKSQWMIINLYNSMTRGAVPIFFMLSGAFLLNKDIDIKDLYNKKNYSVKSSMAYLVIHIYIRYNRIK